MLAPARPITAIDEKYRVIARVGRGGVADVYLAVARGPGGFNKLVVLKSLREEFRGAAEYRDMFMAEARFNAQLIHPHIVQTNEVFEFEGLPVIVMEYLEGQSLGAVVRTARKASAAAFDQSMHLRVLSDILHALDYAHNKQGIDGSPLNLVHCDVTPQNVLLTYEGEVKLLDFGIARLISPRGRGTVDEVQGGKTRYMPPEHIQRVGVDQRTDLYAVGVMAWEAAAGVRLWQDATEEEICDAVLAGEIPPPSSVNEDVDPELERIVMRALEPDKRKRYPSALAMQRELDGFLGISGMQLRSRDIGAAVTELFAQRREQTRAIVAGQLAKLAALPEGGQQQLPLVDLPSRVPLVSDRPAPPGSRRRVRRPALVVAIAAMALVGSAGVLWLTRDEPAVAEEAPLPQRVEVTITAFPREATIVLDGMELGSNPYRQVVERSTDRHEIRVSAPGYETAVRTITLDATADVVISLTAQPSVAKSPLSPDDSPTTLRPTDSVGAGVPNTPNCDPPDDLDEEGIKSFIPECP